MAAAAAATATFGGSFTEQAQCCAYFLALHGFQLTALEFHRELFELHPEVEAPKVLQDFLNLVEAKARFALPDNSRRPPSTRLGAPSQLPSSDGVTLSAGAPAASLALRLLSPPAKRQRAVVLPAPEYAQPAEKAMPTLRTKAVPQSAPPAIWLRTSSGLARDGLPDIGPAVCWCEGYIRLLESSPHILERLLAVLGLSAEDVVIEDDPVGYKYPGLRHMWTANTGQAEVPLCFALCKPVEKWAMGVAPTQQQRHSVATLAIAVALSADLDSFVPVAKLYPDFVELCETSGVSTGDKVHWCSFAHQPREA